MSEREMKFCLSVNSNTFNRTNSIRPIPYLKDHLPSMWATYTVPPAKPEDGPTLTEKEQRDRDKLKNNAQKRAVSVGVFHRANMHDECSGAEWQEAEYRKLVDKRISYLTTAPHLRIFNINMALEEKERLQANKDIRARNKKRAARRLRNIKNKSSRGKGKRSSGVRRTELVSDDEEELADGYNEEEVNNNKSSAVSPCLSIVLNNTRWQAVTELHTAHVVNCGRIPYWPESLTSLQPNVGAFLGVCTAMFYIKYDQAGDFSMHNEQCFFPFVNYCHAGTCLWWSVPYSSEKDLIRYTNDIGHKHGVFNKGVDLNTAEPGIAKAFLCARTLTPDPHELANDYGIPVERHEQEEGDVVIGHGFMYHMGTAGSGRVVNEAINAVPVWWLKSGLPELVTMLETDLTAYMRAWRQYQTYRRNDSTDYTPPRGVTLECCEQLFDQQLALDYCRIIPIAWFKCFARVLLYHLRAECTGPSPSSSRNSTVKASTVGIDLRGWDKGDLHAAVQYLERAEQWMESTEGVDVQNLQGEVGFQMNSEVNSSERNSEADWDEMVEDDAGEAAVQLDEEEEDGDGEDERERADSDYTGLAEDSTDSDELA